MYLMGIMENGGFPRALIDRLSNRCIIFEMLSGINITLNSLAYMQRVSYFLISRLKMDFASTIEIEL